VFGVVLCNPAARFCWCLCNVSLELYSGRRSYSNILFSYGRNTRCVSARPTVSAEGVTILRPLKGIDTEMESCLNSAFLQDYPKFEVIFCVEADDDPAIEVANRIIDAHPDVDARLMVGRADYGPNPKVNNLAKGYAAAKYDIVWVLDSNVWISPGAMGRSVDTFNRNPRTKLVHHLPMCVSINPGWKGNWGAKLDEMFMLTSHSKFYTALNTMAFAPCVMGKSNLYRRSDLDRAVNMPDGQGIRKFALYIAEDNMIADALWKAGGRTAMTSDSAIQPLGDVSLDGYFNRRVRWLRVRRYMVLAATMVEPTTESIVCGLFGTFAWSVLIFNTGLWNWKFFLIHMLLWCLIDYWHFHNLLAFKNVEHFYGNVPFFAKKFYSPNHGSTPRSFFRSWFWVWCLREVLALPIWITALSGDKIQWRNRPFIIKPDLTAEEA
jgi:ceramide glucosyltransferase